MEFLAHFGLDRLPLTREATNFDYYQGARHARVLLDIQGRLAQGESRISVTAAAGMGKSMLAYRLAEILSPELFCVCLLRESVINLPGHVEAMIAAVYGSTDGDQIAARKDRGIQPVVVVDAADRLHAQSEAMLDELSMAGVALVRFAREGASDLTLEPWDEGALARMLLHRIRAAGANRPLFDKEAILAIVRRSAGNPGVAVMLSNEALWCAWHCGLESVSASIAETLCQGDLDAESLGSSAAGRAVPAIEAEPRTSQLRESVDDSTIGSQADFDVQSDELMPDTTAETADDDAILGASASVDAFAQTPASARDFPDQSQFMQDAVASPDEPVMDLMADESLGENSPSVDISGADWGADLSADLNVELASETANGNLPGSTDDFDISQLDALVAQVDAPGNAMDDEPSVELSLDASPLDDELAAFEALASTPKSTAVGVPPVAVPEPVATSEDEDLDDMFASLENESAVPASPSKAAKAPVAPTAASEDPLDDIDAMLGSWESQDRAAPSPAKPAVAAKITAQKPAAPNIEDELDDLLAKFDS